MGNFEKLGVLVVIVLAVVILVLTIWGMNTPQSQLYTGEGGTSKLNATAKTPSEKSDPVGRHKQAKWPATKHGNAATSTGDGSNVESGALTDETGGGQVTKVVAPAPPKPIEYTIKAGDVLSSIAAHYYGSTRYWKAIAKANPSVNPNALRIGAKLELPARSVVVAKSDEKADPASRTRATPAGGGRAYTVRPGDTLWSIAKLKLGSVARQMAIVKANPGVFHGEKNAVLAVGTVLKIPSR